MSETLIYTLIGFSTHIFHVIVAVIRIHYDRSVNYTAPPRKKKRKEKKKRFVVDSSTASYTPIIMHKKVDDFNSTADCLAPERSVDVIHIS